MTPIECAIKGIEQASKSYLQDLEAMTEDQILGSVGGGARKPIDFTFETAIINRRVAARVAGTTPPEMPKTEGWIEAPEELRSKEAIIAYFKSASDELVGAAKGLPESEGDKMVGREGHEQPAYDLV